MAAARTFTACAAVALYVLLVGPPAMAWTLLTKRPKPMYTAGWLGVRLGFLLTGIRVRIEGAEHMRPGAVYACNHASNLEPPAVFLALRRYFPHVRVIYKAEMRRIPVLTQVFDTAGFVPIERANRGQSWPAVERAAQALSEGNAFFIFPEGTRSRTGQLLPFKKGGFVMAIRAQAPVVPVAVLGGRQSMRKGSALIWPATIRVCFLPPVPSTGLTIDDRDALVADVRAAIEAKLLERPNFGPVEIPGG